MLPGNTLFVVIHLSLTYHLSRLNLIFGGVTQILIGITLSRKNPTANVLHSKSDLDHFSLFFVVLAAAGKGTRLERLEVTKKSPTIG